MVLQVLPLRHTIRVARIGQKLDLLVQLVGRAEQHPKFLRRGIEILKLAHFHTQCGRTFRVAQKVLFHLGRAQNALKFGARLLPYFRQFRRIGILSLATHRVKITLKAILGVNVDLFERLFGVCPQRAQDRPVEHNAGPRRPGQIGQIPSLPIRAQQPPCVSIFIVPPPHSPDRELFARAACTSQRPRQTWREERSQIPRLFVPTSALRVPM